jgi:hypothetical protein
MNPAACTFDMVAAAGRDDGERSSMTSGGGKTTR